MRPARSAEEQAGRVSAGKLLLLEAVTLRLVSKDIARATDDATLEVVRDKNLHKAALLGLFFVLSTRLASDLRQTLTRRRQAAREESTERLRIELRVGGVTRAAESLASYARRLSEDTARAHLAADSLATQWRSSVAHAALKALRQKADLVRAVDQVRRPMEARAARTSATETANAYNDEHRRALAEALKGDPDLAASLEHVGLVRQWNAVLDRRTCRECRAHDGELAPLGGSFEGGDEPGELHSMCRCLEVVLSLRAGLAMQKVA